MRGKSLLEELYDAPYEFDFFQAVHLLERADPLRDAIGWEAPPNKEVVRIRSIPSLNFPPSQIYSLERPSNDPPVMTVWFDGLFGPKGVLPTHFTERIIELLRGRFDDAGDQEPLHVARPVQERTALRDWLDLFNHRLYSLFYRSWEKYNCTVPFARYLRARVKAGESLPGAANTIAKSAAHAAKRAEPDPFTLAMYNLVGLGPRSLRNRVQVAIRLNVPSGDFRDDVIDKKRLVHIDDLGILHYSGLFAQRPRNAQSLKAIVSDLFDLPVEVQQFSGQWLDVPPTQRSSLVEGGNNELGLNVVAGERVWDVVSSFRLRIGPLDLATYQELMPDRAPRERRKTFFLLCQIIRLYVGPEFDFEIQLVLKGPQVPECQMVEGGRDVLGPRLGWNTWLKDGPMCDANDGYFACDETDEISAEVHAAA